MYDPQAALQAILQPAGLKATLFPPTSRYHNIEIATIQRDEQREFVYLRRRFVPDPARFELLHEHLVTEGERLDIIASHYLGDPEQFWRICDANGVLDPEELTEKPGRRVRITLPEGMPGMPSGVER